jgi:hypothetical protein
LNHYAAIESDRGAGHPLGFEAKVNADALRMIAPISEILQSQGAGLLTKTEGT